MAGDDLLFEEFVRVDAAPSRYAEPRFEFLNRVNTPFFAKVRGVLNEWMLQYPRLERKDLRARLRSGDDRQATAAFWELYLHQSLLRGGFIVTLHPDVPGTANHPDFLAASSGGAMYVEAVIAAPGTPLEDATERRVNEVFDLIDKITAADFFLDAEVDEVGPSAIRTKLLRRELEAWLQSLDADEVTKSVIGGNLFTDGPVFKRAGDGWSLRFVAVPKSPEFRGKTSPNIRPIGSMSVGGVSKVDRRFPIRRVLEGKSARYGLLQLPFVLAVHVQENFAEESTVDKVLFGDSGTQLSMAQLAAVGLDGFFNTTRARPVSAVLTATELSPWTAAKHWPTLWHNPNPIHPLTLPVPWPELWRSTDGVMHQTPAKSSPCELLGLDPEWPGPEPAFPD